MFSVGSWTFQHDPDHRYTKIATDELGKGIGSGVTEAQGALKTAADKVNGVGKEAFKLCINAAKQLGVDAVIAAAASKCVSTAGDLVDIAKKGCTYALQTASDKAAGLCNDYAPKVTTPINDFLTAENTSFCYSDKMIVPLDEICKNCTKQIGDSVVGI